MFLKILLFHMHKCCAFVYVNMLCVPGSQGSMEEDTGSLEQELQKLGESVRALAALPEDPSLAPSTHTITCTCSSKGSQVSSF